jgi:single-strand DNA-binding protein
LAVLTTGEEDNVKMNGTIEAAFIGRIGTEPELRTSQTGKPWAAVTCAVGIGDDVHWVRVAVFGEVAEQITGTLRKGDKAYVEGTLRLNTWTDREGNQRSGLSVAAWRVDKLGQIGRNKPRRPKAPPEGEHPASISITGSTGPASAMNDLRRSNDDTIPF